MRIKIICNISDIYIFINQIHITFCKKKKNTKKNKKILNNMIYLK